MSVDFDLHEGVATITINRPERMNAMDQEHYRALSEVWVRVRDDEAVRVAVITGAGEKAFSTGADIKDYLTRDTSWAAAWATQQDQLLNRGLEVWKPVVAAVNGICVGGGLTLLLATDIRVASEHATFALPEVKRGVIAANGGTQRVLAQLPHAIAMEMLLTGDAINAETALRFGLINKIAPTGELLSHAQNYAQRVAVNAPLAVRAAKELAIRSRDLDLNSGLRLEQLVARLLRETADAKEGPAAFREKRPADFKGA